MIQQQGNINKMLVTRIKIGRLIIVRNMDPKKGLVILMVPRQNINNSSNNICYYTKFVILEMQRVDLSEATVEIK